MGDLIFGIDFRSKKRFPPIKSPLQEGLETIARGLSLETPPEVLVAIYESSLGFIGPIEGLPPSAYWAPEKDPA